MQGQSESQDSIVGLVAKAAATTGGGSRSEDFSPTALTTEDQQVLASWQLVIAIQQQ